MDGNEKEQEIMLSRKDKGKKKMVEYFSFLPDEILFDILILLPRELLRYKYRYVCKRWLNIINNRILLDHASLILQEPTEQDKQFYTTRLVDIHEGIRSLKMEEQYLDIPCSGRIRSWCNELLLITDPYKHGSLYVFNLITKEGSSLPPCSSTCRGHVRCRCGLGLAFDPFKGVYKVVHVFVGVESIQCEILVLKCKLSSFNCSKWKKINVPSYTGQRQYYLDDPVSIQGRYLHWEVNSSKYVLSMDTVNERFSPTSLPECRNSSVSNRYCFFEMGGFLALQHTVCATQIDIWILKDFERMVWEKSDCIRNLFYVGSTKYPGSILPVPITSLQNMSNLIFRKKGAEIGLFGYDLKYDVVEKLDIRIASYERCVV